MYVFSHFYTFKELFRYYFCVMCIPISFHRNSFFSFPLFTPFYSLQSFIKPCKTV